MIHLVVKDISIEGYNQKIREALKRICFVGAQNQKWVWWNESGSYLNAPEFKRTRNDAEAAMVLILSMTKNIEHFRLHISKDRTHDSLNQNFGVTAFFCQPLTVMLTA